MPYTPFTAARVTRTYRQTINAPPARVFRLICPVREADWLEGWQHTMVYSTSGIAEEGAVFTTPSESEGDTVWIVTRHDPAKKIVEFTRFTPRSRVCVLRIAVKPARGGRSLVDIAYIHTGLTPAGNALLDCLTEEEFRRGVTFWEDSMNYWLKSGRQLKKAGMA